MWARLADRSLDSIATISNCLALAKNTLDAATNSATITHKTNSIDTFSSNLIKGSMQYVVYTRHCPGRQRHGPGRQSTNWARACRSGGIRQAVKTDRILFWAAKEGGPGFAIAKPLDGEAATVGNGSMIALSADTPEQVDNAYQKALELGGSDEGSPSVRDSGFYVAYFRDLDGNKVCLFCAGT